MTTNIEAFTQKEFNMSRAEFENVAESFPLYDTLIVCPVMYGSEENITDWYTSFPAMSVQQEHSFFKSRTEATAGLMYCNKQTLDSMDYAFIAYSFGVSFWSPGVRTIAMDDLADSSISTFGLGVAHWWETELPRHCSIDWKVQQDVILELPAMAAPPGYGPVGAGTSFEHEQIGVQANTIINGAYMPVMNMGVTQGAPYIKNRFPFRNPIGVPRTSVIESRLQLSSIARYHLEGFLGEPYYYFPNPGGTSAYTKSPARFGITVSIFGKRLVQQRAQYHR